LLEFLSFWPFLKKADQFGLHIIFSYSKCPLLVHSEIFQLLLVFWPFLQNFNINVAKSLATVIGFCWPLSAYVGLSKCWFHFYTTVNLNLSPLTSQIWLEPRTSPGLVLSLLVQFKRCCDTLHNDIQHNGIQHNDIQHNDI